MAQGFMIGSECADWWEKRNNDKGAPTEVADD